MGVNLVRKQFDVINVVATDTYSTLKTVVTAKGDFVIGDLVVLDPAKMEWAKAAAVADLADKIIGVVKRDTKMDKAKESIGGVLIKGEVIGDYLPLYAAANAANKLKIEAALFKSGIYLV